MGIDEDSPIGPNKNKMIYDFENDYFKIGACEMQGWRKTMEDAAIILSNFDKKNTSLFGILDGHGGSIISKFVAYNLKALLIRTESYKNGNYEQALIESFLLMDDILKDPIINDFLIKSQFQKQLKIDAQNKDEGNLVKFHFETNCIVYSLTKVFNNLSHNSKKKVFTTIYSDTKIKKTDLNISGLQTNTTTPKDEKILEDPISDENEEKQGIEIDENFNEEKFLINLKNSINENTTKIILKKESTDKIIADLMGTTANIMLIKENNLYLANVGDSLSVMYCKNGKTIKLNREHKTTLKSETERIEKSGNIIKNKRINGILNLARALGDLGFKSNYEIGRNEQSVISYPEITKISNMENIDFIIMGCDGIWDCHPDKEKFCQEIKQIIKNNPEGKLSDILQQKFDEAISEINGVPIGTDNMSCIIIQFKHYGIKEESGEGEDSSDEVRKEIKNDKN